MKERLKNILMKIRLGLKYISKQEGNPEKIFQNTITINIAFLSITLAFYIAISSYFSPQLKQVRQDRDLKFNRMLVALDKTISGRVNVKENTKYYNNDTLDIAKISNSIFWTSQMAAKYFDRRDDIPILDLVKASNQYLDTLKLISLISNHLFLNSLSPTEEKKEISFNQKILSDIENFFLYMRMTEHERLQKDIKLIEYCSRYMYYSGTDSTGMEHIIWVHTSLDSLKREYEKTHNYRTMNVIVFFEEGLSKQIKQLSIYSSFYENIRSINQDYILDINDLSSKILLYENILDNLKKINLSIILIFLFNICIPVLFINTRINDRIAIFHFFIGIIFYFYPIYVIIENIIK